MSETFKTEVNFYMMRAHRRRSCRRSKSTGKPKVRHTTEKAARLALEWMHQEHPDQQFVMYKCRHCSFWHIGHKSEFNNEHERSVPEQLSESNDTD